MGIACRGLCNPNFRLMTEHWRSAILDILLYTNIDQKLVNSLHGLLNCEIDGLDCRVITTGYRTRVPFITQVSPILQCVDPCYLFRSVWSMFVFLIPWHLLI